MPLFGPPNVEKLAAKHKVEGLIKALTYKKDQTIRKEAAQALGQIGDAQATKPLIAILRDENESVRVEAIKALGQIGDPQAVEALIARLKYDSSYVSVAAADALVKIGAPAVKLLIHAIDPHNKKAAEALGRINGAQAVESLIALLKEQYVSINVAVALVKIGAPAVNSLIVALEDDSNHNRTDTAYALGQIGDARATKPLIAILKDEDESVRVEAIKALGQIGDPQAVEALIALLGDESSRVSVAAIDALGEIGAPAVESLIPLLRNSGWIIRKNASEALQKMGWEPREDIERAAYWIAIGDVNRLAELNCQAIKQLLIESMEWQMAPDDWHVKGRIAKLLVCPEIAANDSILAWAVDELEVCAKKYRKELDRMVQHPRRSGDSIDKRDRAMFEDYADLILTATSYHTSGKANPSGIGWYKHDTSSCLSAVKHICQIMTPVSTNVLHHLRQLRDIEVITATFEVEYDHNHSSGMGERTEILSFVRQRKAATRELARRGNPDYDLSVYKAEGCWRIPK